MSHFDQPVPCAIRRLVWQLPGAALLATCGMPAWSQAAPTEIRLVSDEWHKTARKDGTGLYFDLIRMVYEKHGVKVQITIVPYARGVRMVEAQRADAWVASFLNEKDFPLYPKWHFDRDIEVVIFKKEKAAGWTGTASLRDQKVGWMRDYGFDRYIREPMKISEVDHYDDAFKLLAAGRFDYFIAGQKDIDEVIKKTQTNTAPFDIRPLMNLGVYLAFANNARGGALRKIWDDEMETLHKTDAFKAAYKKYDQPYPFPLNN